MTKDVDHIFFVRSLDFKVYNKLGIILINASCCSSLLKGKKFQVEMQPTDTQQMHRFFRRKLILPSPL